MQRALAVVLFRTVLPRGTNATCVALFVLLGIVNLRAQSAYGMRAICFVQVGNADHVILPLAISDSDAGAKWCQQKIGMRIGIETGMLSPSIVSPAIMTQFLAELRTVGGTQEKIPARSSAYKFVLLQPEGQREIILVRPTAHDLIKRLARHSKGTQLYEYLVFIGRELGSPRKN
jgi:hypothetical protein